jgi:hypothetical protein
MRLAFGSLLFLLLPGCTVALAHQLGFLWNSETILWSCLSGTCLGILADEFILRRIAGFETFEHEFTHAVAALMFFRRIHRFVVTRNGGGLVSHSGGLGGEIGDEFIGLAPYVLPTFTFLSALVRPFVPHEWFPWFDVWIGFTFGYHFWSTAREVRLNWTAEPFPSAGTGEWTLSDIGRRGFLYSVVFIVTTGLAIHGLLLAIILRGFQGAVSWSGDVWSVTTQCVNLIVTLATQAVHWIQRT